MTKATLEATALPDRAQRLTFAEARSRYQGLVFCFVANRIRPVQEAEDVVANVFVDAYRHWGRCKGDLKRHVGEKNLVANLSEAISRSKEILAEIE